MSNTVFDSQPQQVVPPASQMPQYGLNNSELDVDYMLDIIIRFLIDFVQRIIASPAERLKVLTTVEGELKRQGRLPTMSGFGGVLACIRRVWRSEGALGFLRGVGADLLLSLPAGFVDSFSMALVSILVQKVVPTHLAESIGLPMAITVTMGATSLAVMFASPYFALRRSIMTNYMADIVAPPPARTAADNPDKENSAVEEGKSLKKEEQSPTEENSYLYASAWEATQSIYRRQGLRAFYRGALVDPILVMIYRGLYIGVSMLIPMHLREAHPYSIVSALSLVSDISMQPFEVLSRRMILTASDDVHPPYNGMLDCMKSIVREEGATGLWSGLRCRAAVNIVGLGIRIILGNLFLQQ